MSLFKEDSQAGNDHMYFYRLSEQNFCFPHPFSELMAFAINAEVAGQPLPFAFDPLLDGDVPKFVSRVTGWVAGAQRLVKVHITGRGMQLNIEGAGEFLIAPHGEAICKQNSSTDLTKLDQEVILGPALVLALALRGIWSLHASAAMFSEKVIVFLGESGQGKSTLARYLSMNPNWHLIADDILPVEIDANGMSVLPHFPQLKIPVAAQPGPSLPGRLPLANLCVLTPTRQDTIPELQLLPPSLAIQALLRHTAGTRMFTPEMLGQHLSFCSSLARRIPVYQLLYPHRRDILPTVQDLLETLC
jgi:hypothetical protein